MKPTELVIIHVDDELHLVEQMPDQVRLQFNLLHPDLKIGDLEETLGTAEGDATSNFSVDWPDGRSFQVIYRVLAQMPEHGWSDVTLVIFDYLTMNNSVVEPLAKDRVREAVQVLGEDNVYVFTGYPDPAYDLKNIVADGNFIVKPGDSVAMTAQLVDRLFCAMGHLRERL